MLDRLELLSGAWDATGQIRIPQVRAVLRDLSVADVPGSEWAAFWVVENRDALGGNAAMAARPILWPIMQALRDDRPIHDGLCAAIAGEYRGVVLEIEQIEQTDPPSDVWHALAQHRWELHRMRCLLEPALLHETFVFAEQQALAGGAACNDSEAEGWMELAAWCGTRMMAA